MMEEIQTKELTRKMLIYNSTMWFYNVKVNGIGIGSRRSYRDYTHAVIMFDKKIIGLERWVVAGFCGNLKLAKSCETTWKKRGFKTDIVELKGGTG